jgi:hypothetical protein
MPNKIFDVTEIFNFESLTHGTLELHNPLGVVACAWEVIDIEADHGENTVRPAYVDVWLGHLLSPSE